MLHLTTRVNALARITIGGVNITATTALQAIDPNGREIALRRGANVLMPILTPTKWAAWGFWVLGFSFKVCAATWVPRSNTTSCCPAKQTATQPRPNPRRLRYRENYQLYEGKPCITDTADECRK
jgi:hypothetical protein